MERLNQEPQPLLSLEMRQPLSFVMSPAQICMICGEEYVDAQTGKRLSQIAETAVSEGIQVDVRRYKAA
jgi:hypothetical protein